MIPTAIYVWLVPSEHVQEQPGSWRIRKWDTEPFPEANFTLASQPEGERCCQHATPGLSVCRFMLEACERGDYKIDASLPQEQR